MEDGKVKMSSSLDVAREHSARQCERSKSLVEPGTACSQSNSMPDSIVSQLQEVTISISPTEVEPVVLTFEGLQPLINVDLDDPLPNNPGGALHGVLENGIRYYVRKNAKPRDRAALALAVSVGSILEEDGEQGVAHIVEHLAFSATKDYTNHDLVVFMESIGCEFGACNNAYTSFDETVYELLVPVDKPEILSTALHVLSEFSTEVRASEEDLEKERGAVLEEWRNRRTSSGRLSASYWKLLMEGSKYADHRPIGKEEVIRNVSAQRVRDFYRRWYRPENMAVIAVGDFSDLEGVVKRIKLEFEVKQGHSSPCSIPTFPVPSHDEPRFSCSVDSETSRSSVDITCKAPYKQSTTIKDSRFLLVVEMFCDVFNDRLFRISKQKEPPFFSCSSYTGALARPAKGYSIKSTCPEGGTLQALEQMLIEIARVRLHGFSEREIAVARAAMMVSLKSWYLQRDQLQSTEWRDKYVWHFLHGDAIPPIEYQAQLQKTLLSGISAPEVSKIAEQFYTTCNCIIRTIEPHVKASEEDLKAIVEKVTEMERQGSIGTWNEQTLPDAIIKDLPSPGVIVNTKHYPEFDATEITLGNGMRVCYKCTAFLDDEILVRGITYGGISEVDESNYYSCKMAASFSREIGKHGLKPTILEEMLAGKKVHGPHVGLGYYTRNFSGDCSPSDLETALQLVYLLFVTRVEPAEEEVELVMQRYLEAIKNRERDPASAYYNRIRALTYGNSYFYEPWVAESLSNVDPKKACQYFNDCYADPSTFTVMMVGAINTVEALPLILQYLGGIPKPEKPVMNYSRESLSIVPFNPASQIVREEVRREMVESQCKVYICFPIHLERPSSGDHAQYSVENFMCKFLETKIRQSLRFKHGKVYSVSVYATLPFIYVENRGHVAVSFSCDPEMAWKLVDLTLDEIKRLQEEEPSVNGDVSTVLELEQREYETLQELQASLIPIYSTPWITVQDNYYWISRLVQAYLSELYSGDLETSFKAEDELRVAVRGTTNSESMKETLCRVLPFPCTKDYKVVVLMPTELKSAL